MTIQNNSPNGSKISGNKPKRPPKPKPQIDDRPIAEALAAHHITDWDVALIGDGSGNSWQIGCGWSCCLVERQTHLRRQFYGGMNSGTVNIGELMAYLHALTWWTTIRAPQLRRQLGRLLRCAVITDSQVTAHNATKLQTGQMTLDEVKYHRPLWAGIVEVGRSGVQLDWYWLKRSTLALNCFADALAGLSRVAVEQVRLQDRSDQPPLSPHDFNK